MNDQPGSATATAPAPPDMAGLRAGKPAPAPITVAGIRTLWPLLAERKTPLLIAAGLSLVAAATALAQPLLVSRVISAVQVGDPLGGIVVLLVGMLIVTSLLSAVQQYLLGRTAESVVLGTRMSLTARLLRLPIAEYDRRRSGDLLARVGTDTTLLRMVVSGGLVDAAASVLTVVGATIAMAVVDWVLLMVTMASVAVGVTAGVVVAVRIKGFTLASQQAVGDMSSAVSRVLAAVRTIRVAGATEREDAAVAASARAAYQASVRAVRMEATAWPLVGFAVQGAFVAVLGVGGYRVASGAIGVADLVSFILYVFLLVMPLGGLMSAFTQLQMGLGAMTRIEEVLALAPEDDGPERAPSSGPIASAPRVALDHASFDYPDGTAVLREVTFAVPTGRMTALVGPSGAGKSTLLALVARLYDLTGGRLLVDGVDAAELRRSEIRRRIGYVEQETPILAGSLRDNLALAAPDASDTAILEMLGAVRLTELVERSPAGLSAEVGEGGVLLSGGERQRLAIARALLARPDLLLLDEPTSSLDARNEAALRAVLADISGRCTVLVVAHRLSTVVDADQIVVVDHGRVVGRGTHGDLLASTPLYRELASTQLLA